MHLLPDTQGFINSCHNPTVIPAVLGLVSLSSVLV